MNEHTIKPGDTLGHIALRFYGRASLWELLYRMNRRAIHDEQRRRGVELGPHWIFPGTRLRLP